MQQVKEMEVMGRWSPLGDGVVRGGEPGGDRGRLGKGGRLSRWEGQRGWWAGEGWVGEIEVGGVGRWRNRDGAMPDGNSEMVG